VVRVGALGAEGPGFKTQLVHRIFQKTLSVYPAVNVWVSGSLQNWGR